RTIVVHREQSGRYAGGREPFLQRWLFSPRLAIVALIVALGVGLGVGGWWLTSGRYASIPVVANDSVATATAALKQDGFTIAKVSPVHSNQVAQGTVTGTSPSGRAAKGSAVTILVSSGPFTSIVPRVQGDKLPAAEAALQRAHLTYSIERVGSTQPVGTVLGTKPGAGTSWPQTKPVAIKVAEGLPVPNFGGQSLQVAQQWAAAHGANLQQQQDQNSQQPQGTITGQEPTAGSLYQPGETVVVNVSNGPQEVNVPDVIGMSVQEATQALQAAGFRPQVQSFGLPGASNDRVWDYSPVGQAPRGSTILLDVLPGNNQGGGGGF
ncbi:MAG TPA: PASTA domain-containing protein, partial [Streptosporangiaceae bacterium]|nr:PASTA domain-containing protein [Streptosporangiaceae bacterium]